MTIRYTRFWLFFLVFLIAAFLEFYLRNICYYFSGVVGYFYVNEVSLADYFLTVVFSLVPVAFLPLTGFRPSLFLVWLIYLLHYLPTILTYPHLPIEQVFWWRPLIFIFFSALVFLGYRFHNKTIKIRINKLDSIYIPYIVLLIFYAFSVFILIRDHGFSLNPPSLMDVYGQRAIFKDKSSFVGGYVGVISGFFLSPFLIILAVYNLKARNILFGFFFCFLSIFLSYLIYSSSGFKSVAFSCVVVLSFYFLLKIKKPVPIILCSAILVFLAISYLALPYMDVAGMHWVRRIFIITGMNVNYFFDYFLGNNFRAWDLAPSIIAEVYYDTYGSANSGIIGDALARAGFFGFPINAFFYLIIIKMSDYVKDDDNKSYLMPMMVMTGYAICNSSITTVFTTYGFVFLILFFFLFKGVFAKNAS